MYKCYFIIIFFLKKNPSNYCKHHLENVMRFFHKTWNFNISWLKFSNTTCLHSKLLGQKKSWDERWGIRFWSRKKVLFLSTTLTLTKRIIFSSLTTMSINLISHAFAGNPLRSKTPKPHDPLSPSSAFEFLKTHLLQNPENHPHPNSPLFSSSCFSERAGLWLLLLLPGVMLHPVGIWDGSVWLIGRVSWESVGFS